MAVEITTHRIEPNSDNEHVLIHFYPQAPNEIISAKPGEKYQIWSKSNNTWEKKSQIQFGKHGPNGFDGITPEVLLAVILDREVQRGAIPRVEDDEAKHRIVQALNVLKGGQSTKYVPPPPPEPVKPVTPAKKRGKKV